MEVSISPLFNMETQITIIVRQKGSIAIGAGWEIKDATIVMEDQIRLTPNENGRAGLITNNKGMKTKLETKFQNYE